MWMLLLCFMPLWETGYSIWYRIRYAEGGHFVGLAVNVLFLGVAYAAIYFFVRYKANWLAESRARWRLPIWVLIVISSACGFVAIRLM